MDLDEELKRIAAAARQLAPAGEELAGVIPTEPEAGRRVYLCAFQGASRTWLALDDGALPVDDRALVRSAVSIAALCELAEESAGGGKLEELGPYDRMFYVYHSGQAETDDERVSVIGPDKLAEMVVDAGLTSWLIRKIS